jgi:DNA-binding FadR family transcriptional regulator
MIYAAIKEDRVEEAEKAVTEHAEFIKAFLTVRFDRFF